MMLAGFYEKEITPRIGAHMPGSFELRNSIGVKDERLMVKGIAFELNNKRVIILSADVLYIPQECYELAIKKINEYTGTTEENILIQATHSHTAGPIWDVQEGKVPADKEYIISLGHMIADCGILAFHRMIPVKARFAKTTISGITFVRNYIMRDGNIRTNPQPQDPEVVSPFGIADEEFQVLYFFDMQGTPVGSITNFSCHHCCANSMEYCADYSGVLARELKKHFGMDYINVMLSGASGNLNHFDFYAKDRTRGDKKIPRYVQMGMVMSETVVELLDKSKPISLDVLNSKKEIMQMKKREVPVKLLEEVKELYEKIPYEKILDLGNLAMTDSESYKRSVAYDLFHVSKMPSMLPVCVQVIRIGECMICGLSGEPFAEFGISIKQKSPAQCSMIASIANGCTIGYIPTREAFNTTIYEAQLVSARLECDTGYKMVDKAIELASDIWKI